MQAQAMAAVLARSSPRRRTAIAATQDPLEWSALMARAQAGDNVAYRQLLVSITPYLRSIASRAHRNPSDAEDAVQDILLTIHTVRSTYDPARPLKPWLAGIARHRIIDRLRQSSRSIAKEVPLEPEHETFKTLEPNTEGRAFGERALQAALATLPPGQREAVTLLKVKELSLKEAEQVTGMSIAALKVATHRGIKALRKLLGEREDG